MVERAATSLRDYVAALSHTTYLYIWLAECIKQAGNWFTFVAAYAVITELSGADAATHTALFLICRRAPYLVLFPLTGLAADRLNRGALLVVVCLLQGAVSFSLPLVRFYGKIELLYPLVLLQYSAQAFYDPARMASVPLVVPPKYLCVAGTLDTYGYSFMALGGATLAGRTAAVYGTGVCFVIEGISFLLAAAMNVPLARHVAARRGPQGKLSAPGASSGLAEPSDAAPLLQPLLSDAGPSGPTPGAQALRELEAPAAASEGGLFGFLGALSYMSRRPNWDVAVLVWVKATGAMVWGAADVLNGRFAQSVAMQSLGGPDQTLGLILAGMGLGCVVGPLIANGITPGVARFWRISIAVAFVMLSGGYALMARATNIWYVLPATVLRSSGSNTLWCHSLAILQHRLEDSIRGRVFAVEFVLYTISEAGSTLFGGYALDGLSWGSSPTSAALAGLAAVFAAVWALHAVILWRDRR
ncbi:hypothetical protein HYH03_004940 [Edaphochlamys debaryana]|uniref:Major facilitator superfamily (MFS) profile domain-containing protein n=1 Tax=Edaphochlamys debaryana TaxID=47281 RepID=A0A835Y890_9CHLO|nr:hypothetical protein HYH03_004940 [Edaphochlamys debaryana]|eukprot:KAG2496934.1 hypothetical protein HYH03_004940 [Edaphochlamys debaryana]